MTLKRFLPFCLFILLASIRVHADVVLLVGEPYGRYGALNPTGHSALYLTRICAESPIVLRRCEAGEIGAVISRYHNVAKRDWLAIPLIPYLYAVERADLAPVSADRKQVAALRDAYRRKYLLDLLPDDSKGKPPKGNWFQLVGSVYDRQIAAFRIPTTAAEDDELIRELNSQPNEEGYNMFVRNCADFVRDIVNFYYPNATKTSFISDMGVTTPKGIAKSLVRYTSQHDVDLTGFLIPQIPGSRPMSGGLRGVLEALVKTKKYLIPLSIVEPWIPGSIAAGYLLTGRFNPKKHVSTVYRPAEIERRAILVDEEHDSFAND